MKGKAAVAVGALLLVGCSTTRPGAAPDEQVTSDPAATFATHHEGRWTSRALRRPAPPPAPRRIPPHHAVPSASPSLPKATGRSRTFTAWATSAGTHRVFNCESHWNPTDVSASGKYRGLIQADATFWKDWHGLQFAARPDLASTTQQLQVAYWAWLKRGWAPWPTCGRLA